MKTLKEAWILMKMEYKFTPPSLIGVLFMITIALFFVLTSVTTPEDQGTIGTEVIFFLIVIGFPYMIRARSLQPQKLGRNHVSPIVIFLQTMPISKRSIATYRVFLYTCTAVIFNSIFFSILYAFSPYMRSIASPGTYIVFAIMWICFAIYAGGYQINMEAGYHLLTYTFFIFLIWFPIFMIASIVLFYKDLYEQGLIQWLLDISEAYPFIVISVSIILAISGFLFHVNGFMKRMERTDY